ncbi:hypothetical protein QMK33_19270 [Hymenobacter sp. H14-R3]|uniref:hypothetical protein n=1 Tax=Hymenobacter sp. H14-R3 TaxID=3046308 RepID=UPI0024B8978C|nr:hypothetical protein [Hymenobacter sp. H14-R3]MDJ0367294.1 hypothetical protein [Hymenobacter sp. H14-R3]
MKPEQITTWLASGQDFAQGAALYNAGTPSKTYQRLFALGATEYSQAVLVRELRALVPAPAPEPAVVVPTSPPDAPAAEPVVLAPPVATAPAPAAPAAGPVLDSHPVLQQVRQQLKAVRDERSHLHPQLTGKNVGKKARGVVALRIVVLTSEEAKLKALEAHVRAHGQLPGPVATDELTDAGELRRRLANRRCLRSKLKNNPARAADLAAVEADILLIQSKLTS